MLLSIPANQSLAWQVFGSLKNATKIKRFRSNVEHAEHAEVFRSWCTKPNASSPCSAFERKRLPAGGEGLVERGVLEVVRFGDRLVGAVAVQGVDDQGQGAVAPDGIEHDRIGALVAVQDGGGDEREGAGLGSRCGQRGHDWMEPISAR